MSACRAGAPLRACRTPTRTVYDARAQLASTEEWIDGQFSGNLGEVLIRCNNVLYLRGVPEEEEGT